MVKSCSTHGYLNNWTRLGTKTTKSHFRTSMFQTSTQHWWSLTWGQPKIRNKGGVEFTSLPYKSVPGICVMVCILVNGYHLKRSVPCWLLNCSLKETHVHGPQFAKVHMHTWSASTTERTSGSRSTSRDSAFLKHPTLLLKQANIATLQKTNTHTHIYIYYIYIYYILYMYTKPLIEKTLVWWLVDTFFVEIVNQRCLGPSFC